MAISLGDLASLLANAFVQGKKNYYTKQRQRFIAHYAHGREQEVEEVFRRITTYQPHLSFYNSACGLLIDRLPFSPYSQRSDPEVYSLESSGLAALYMQGKIWKLSEILKVQVGRRYQSRCASAREYQAIREGLVQDCSVADFAQKAFLNRRFFDVFGDGSIKGSASEDFLNLLISTVHEIAANLFFATVFHTKESAQHFEVLFSLFFVHGNFLVGWNTNTHRPMILSLPPPVSS